jgi:hypothetical protein
MMQTRAVSAQVSSRFQGPILRQHVESDIHEKGRCGGYRFMQDGAVTVPVQLPNSCPICASPFMSWVARPITSFGRGVDLFHCMDCHSFSSPQSPPNVTPSQVEWHKSVRDRNLAWCSDLFDILQPRGPVIDIGAGIGTLLYAARERGLSGVGFDTDEGACAYGRETYGLDLRPELWTPESVKAAGLITCISVLEHIHQPRPLIRDILAAAKKMGSDVYLSVPFVNRDWWRFLKTDNRQKGHVFEQPHVHVTHFSWNGLETVCKEFGARSMERIALPKAWVGYHIKI